MPRCFPTNIRTNDGKVSAMCNLPQAFIEQMQHMLGDALPDFLHTYEQPYFRGIRMRPGVSVFSDAGEEVPWAAHAHYLPLDSRAGAHPLHEAGAYYLQEPSAMGAAAVLHPLPGERVLDLCAAPGGKSTQLAAYMEGKGLIVCNEPVPGRAQVLSRNVERMGIPNAMVTCALPEQLSPRFPQYFDKIMVDAPCSGEGMFRRHPEAREEWNPSSPAGCADRQLYILEHAAQMLRPGGQMVFSTCTFNDTENEGVVQHFLHTHPDFSLLPFSLPGLPPNNGMLHLWPHLIRGEGHFVALLQKEGNSPALCKKPVFPCQPLSKQDMAVAQDFLSAHLVHPIFPSGLFMGHVIALPDAPLPDLKGLRIVRLGLQLGDVKGRLFQPDHALALACPVKYTFSVNEEEARLYQNGQVLPCPDDVKGWLCPVLEGMQLGWGKASQNQIKNHYPKGLRKP